MKTGYKTEVKRFEWEQIKTVQNGRTVTRWVAMTDDELIINLIMGQFVHKDATFKRLDDAIAYAEGRLRMMSTTACQDCFRWLRVQEYTDGQILLTLEETAINDTGSVLQTLDLTHDLDRDAVSSMMIMVGA